MQRSRLIQPVVACAVLCCGALAPRVVAAEDALLPAQTPIPEAIDHYIGAKLSEKGITPAPVLSDRDFLRRVTLDLAGRVPTVPEMESYTASQDPDRKQRLIERLLDSPDCAYHQRNRLDELLLAGIKKDNAWREYLLESVRANKPWDQIFREVMLSDGSDEATAAAAEFLKARVRDVNAMTNDTSRLFFGVSINCAQCHDHPLADDWTMDHYFGFASFFNRTYQTKSNRLAEKFDGELKFRTVLGEEKRAQFMFLTGAVVDEPEHEWTDEQKKENSKLVKASMKEDDAPMPEPEFRPREEFVKVALAPENRRFFAEAIANRMWAGLLGTGLIDPPDQNHSGNPPSHPKLLRWLERDLVAHGYDLKRLIGGIVASDAYARSSAWDGSERPGNRVFAVGQVRALTPRQYSLSLLVATHNPEQLPASTDDPKWAELRKNWEGAAEGLADQLERPSEHFQVSVDEALLFSNGDRIERDYLRDSGDKLIGYVKRQEGVERKLDLLFLSALGRSPDAEERASFTSYLNERSDREVDALKQVLWALLTSPEMRFNH